ncbi:F-box/kelch-repeat protein At1g15670-like [Tasmannia lanceolata]|uniref:F-box/kelch-repeat protein At1g15670-like n=1 Tax=Tasmannia lanceolata TaxID=3420 RepID=UPI0040645A36
MELIPGLPSEIAIECLIRVHYTHFGTVSKVSKLWKEELESPVFHRLRKDSGLSRACVVLAQAEPTGSSHSKYPVAPAYRLNLYDAEAGSWHRLPPVPGYHDGLPLFCQIVVTGRHLVMVGGWNPTTWAISNDVFVYDLVSATWRGGARMPGCKRSFFACASGSDRRVFVAGGHDEGKNALKTALAYDVARNEWASLPDMERERDECKGVFHRGRFHVIGGYSTDTQGEFEKSAEGFDVATWKWGPVEEDMLDAGTCPRSCVADDDGKVFRCREGYVVACEDATWRDVAELPTDVRLVSYAVMWQGKMLVTGTKQYGGPHVAYTLELSEGNKHTWTRIEMPREYCGHVQSLCCLEI